MLHEKLESITGKILQPKHTHLFLLKQSQKQKVLNFFKLMTQETYN
jgi:hypothetical protein